jgi:hypothetical protein
MNRVLEIVIQARDEASKTLKPLQDNLKKAGVDLKSVGIGMTAVGGTITALSAIAIKSGMEFESLSGSFERMTARAGIQSDELLKKLQKVSAGTISNKDIILSANRAMSLGVGKDMDTMTKLMEIARLKARDMGIDTTQAFNDIVTGIGRGSPLILDNLGIIAKVGEANEQYARSLGKTAEELTDTEKKQALLNAVLKAGEKDLKAAGELQKTSAESMQEFKASMDNLVVTIGQQLLPIVTPMIQKVSEMVQRIGAWANEHKELSKIIVGAIAIFGGLLTVLGPILIMLPGIVTGVKLVGAAFVSIKAIISGFSLATFFTGALLPIAGVATAISLAGWQLNKLKTEAVTWENSWTVATKGIKLRFLELDETVSKMFQNLFEKLGISTKASLAYQEQLQAKQREIEQEIFKSTEEAKEKQKADQDEMVEQFKTAFGKMGEAVEEFSGLSKKEMEAAQKYFEATVEGVKQIRDEIKEVYKELNDSVKSYQKSIAQEDQNYQNQIVEKVAEAQYEKAELAKKEAELTRKLKKNLTEDERKRVSDELEETQSKMAEKNAIIVSYEDMGLDYAKQIDEQKRVLAMNELDRITYDHQKKLLMIQKEYLEQQVASLQKLVMLKQEHDTAVAFIGSEKMTAVNAEIAKTQTFREQLEIKTKGLTDWISQQKALYKDYVNSINSILGGISSKASPVSKSIGGSVKSVNDAIITPKGDIISTHPDDYLIATKNLSGLGGGTNINIVVNGDVSGQDLIDKIKSALAMDIKRQIRVV